MHDETSVVAIQRHSQLIDKMFDYAGQARAANSVRAYRADWEDFTSWCAEHDLEALPAAPGTVALYLTDRASSCKVATLQRRITAISQIHKMKGYPPISTRVEPIHAVWSGIRRAHGVAHQVKVAAVTEDIRAMIATLPDTLLGVRDRALLLVGFAAAMRRSELVGLNADHLTVTRDGLVVYLPKRKNDQEGEGTSIGVPYGSTPATCPVRAMMDWLVASGIQEGPVFRSVSKGGKLQDGRLSDKAVAMVVKRCAEAAGLDPAKYGGHSLRAGLATAAAAAGVPERVIMAQTGHRSLKMVRRYIRDGNLFRENAAASVGL